jgi:hypothetical protein
MTEISHSPPPKKKLMLGNTSCLKVTTHKIPGKTYENNKNKIMTPNGENKDRSLEINNMIFIHKITPEAIIVKI